MWNVAAISPAAVAATRASVSLPTVLRPRKGKRAGTHTRRHGSTHPRVLGKSASRDRAPSRFLALGRRSSGARRRLLGASRELRDGMATECSPIRFPSTSRSARPPIACRCAYRAARGPKDQWNQEERGGRCPPRGGYERAKGILSLFLSILVYWR